MSNATRQSTITGTARIQVGTEQKLSGPQILTPDDIKPLNRLMYGLVIVLFLGFAAMFAAVGQMIVDGFRDKQASYQQLQIEVHDQNNKLDTLTQALRNYNQSNH